MNSPSCTCVLDMSLYMSIPWDLIQLPAEDKSLWLVSTVCCIWSGLWQTSQVLVSQERSSYLSQQPGSARSSRVRHDDDVSCDELLLSLDHRCHSCYFFFIFFFLSFPDRGPFAQRHDGCWSWWNYPLSKVISCSNVHCWFQLSCSWFSEPWDILWTFLACPLLISHLSHGYIASTAVLLC